MKKLTIIIQDLISLIKHEKVSLLLILASRGLFIYDQFFLSECGCLPGYENRQSYVPFVFQCVF